MDTLDDIIALIHTREIALVDELEKLRDFKSAFASHVTRATGVVPPPHVHMRATANDHPGESVAVMGNTRTLSDAQRKRISRRMKRYWKERNSKK